jgi:hypothetical protein
VYSPLKVFRCLLAAVVDDVEGDSGAFDQTVKAALSYYGDMDIHVVTAVVSQTPGSRQTISVPLGQVPLPFKNARAFD